MKIKQLLNEALSQKDIDEMEALLKRNGIISGYEFIDDSIHLTGTGDFYLDHIESKIPVQIIMNPDDSFQIHSSTNLKSLVNIPKHVSSFTVINTGLVTMDNTPDYVDHVFEVSGNKNLKNYMIPEETNGDIYLHNNGFEEFSDPFTSTEDVSFSGNKISSFENCPNMIGGDLDLSNNKFESLKSIHEHIDKVIGSLILTGNPIKDGFLDLLKIEELTAIRFASNKVIERIINDNLEQGRAGRLAAQTAMIEAGFEDML